MENDIQKLKDLYQKYNDNHLIKTKLSNYIQVQLPRLLSCDDEINQQYEQRKYEIEKEMDIFIHEFLSQNNIYFVASSGLFFEYDSIHYKVINEDDIHYRIFSEIAFNHKLHPSKSKIKNYIISLIKENCLWNSIPETETIQNVVRFFNSAVFSSKDETKYFLSVIGDAILDKNQNLHHIISPKAKQFLRELNRKMDFYIETSAIDSFRFKYHDERFEDVRLISVLDTIEYINTSSFYKDALVDIIVVSCYFSNRFKSSELFLQNHAIKNVKQYANYFKNYSIDTIFNQFIKEYTEPCKDSSISWKNMLFFWKSFLDAKGLPSISMTSQRKKILADTVGENYDSEDKLFLNMTSKHVPSVAKFLDFWRENLYEDSEEIELEISEIGLLLKKYVGNYDDDTIYKLLTHFYPDIPIVNKKYINGYSCRQWPKKDDILEVISLHESSSKPESIYQTYSTYCKVQGEQGRLVASKQYFEKFIREKFKNKIINNVIYF